jgi:hypothetical protein
MWLGLEVDDHDLHFEIYELRPSVEYVYLISELSSLACGT